MSSSDRSPDLSRVINELSRQVGILAASMPDNGSNRPGSQGAGRAKPKGDLDLGLTSKSLKELTKDIREVDGALNKLQRGATDVTQSHKTLYTAQTALIKGIITGGNKTEAQQQKLINKVDDVIKAHSILGVSLANTAKTAERLNQITEQTGEFLHNYSSILKQAGASSLSNITIAGELEKALKKLQQEMDLGSEITELINKREFAAAAAKIDQDAKNSVLIRNNIKKTTNSFNSLVGSSNALRSGLSKATDAIGAGFVKEAATAVGSIGLIAAGAKEAYSQFKSTASAGFGAEFIKLSGTAISLGISLEALTAITKENMTLIGKMGLREFNDSLKESQIGLMKLGLSTEEAAKTRAVMNENARLTGVDVANKITLNKSAKDQIDTYETLRATTGESIEELAKQTKSIIQSNDTMKIMSSMTRQQRVQMLQGINLERARLTTMGVSNDAATEAIKIIQGMKNEKTISRLDQANNLQAAGAAVGMDGALTDKMAQIMTKPKGAITKEDDQFRADYAIEFNKRNAAMQGNGTDTGLNIVGDTATEWAGSIGTLGETLAGANMDRGLSESEVEANKAMGRIPQETAEGMAKIETGLQVLQSPLTKIVVGVFGIAALLAKLVYTKMKDATKKRASSLPDEPGTSLNANTRGKKKRTLATPGSSISGDSNIGSQIEQFTRRGKNGWRPPEEQGFAGLNSRADQLAAAKRHAAAQATGAGRVSSNASSIGSAALQERLARNRNRINTGDLQNHGQTGLNLPDHGPRGGMLSRIGGAVGRGVGAAGAGIGGGITSGVGKIASFGAKAIPFLGAAIVAIETLKGVFDATERAAEIFGVDTAKTAVTTAQKVSAGIAGALSTISFGLIPVDGTARLLNDVATEGVAVLTDYWENGMELIVNKVIPSLWSGFKTVVGFIGSALIDVFRPSTWINMFTGDGESGFVGSILRSVWKGVEFLGVALTKGVVKFGADILDTITGILPAWMVPEALTNLSAKNTWASSDTHVSDFDTDKEKTARAARKQKRDKRNGNSAGSSIPGTASANPSSSDPIGLVADFGQALTADQLRAQGIQGAPSQSNSATVNSPNNAAAGKDQSGTTVNNTTTNTTTAPKTQTESLLADILNQVTSLVDLTSKGLTINKAVAAESTAHRLTAMGSNNGWAPSMQSFINNIA